MKKAVLLIAVVLLCACSKSDEGSPYTSQQQNAINVFHGKFKAEISKGIFGGYFTQYIEFNEVYSEPIKMKSKLFMGEEIDVEIHGSAYFTDVNGDETERLFYIDRDAEYLRTYLKYENGYLGNEKKQLLNIINKDEFYLYDSGLDGDCYKREKL